MKEYKRNLETLYKVYDKLNVKYFGGTLEKVTITIQKNLKAYGHFTPDKIWSSDTEQTHEINISPNFDRSTCEIVGTLLHEMVHLYAHMNNIQDTSRQGRYHNKDFKKLAEERGLIIKYGGDTIGHSVTECSESLIQWIEDNKINFVKCYQSFVERETKPPKPKPPKYKFLCPTCGLQIETTTEKARLTCLTCGKELQRT